jgi:hypothetical protein
MILQIENVLYSFELLLFMVSLLFHIVSHLIVGSGRQCHQQAFVLMFWLKP